MRRLVGCARWATDSDTMAKPSASPSLVSWPQTHKWASNQFYQYWHWWKGKWLTYLWAELRSFHRLVDLLVSQWLRAQTNESNTETRSMHLYICGTSNGCYAHNRMHIAHFICGNKLHWISMRSKKTPESEQTTTTKNDCRGEMKWWRCSSCSHTHTHIGLIPRSYCRAIVCRLCAQPLQIKHSIFSLITRKWNLISQSELIVSLGFQLKDDWY